MTIDTNEDSSTVFYWLTDILIHLAEASSLQKLTYASYKDAMKSLDTNYLFALDFLMVVFCKEGN